jgi:Tir chaperone protein (CesT) family
VHPVTDIQRVLADLAQRYRIANLQLGPRGTAGIRLADGIELHLEHVQTTNKLFAYTVLGTLPVMEEDRLLFMTQMLEMNCMEQGTQCGTLALDRQQDVVLYQTGMAVEGLTVDTLERTLLALLAQHARLAAELKSERQPAPRSLSSTIDRLSCFAKQRSA